MFIYTSVPYSYRDIYMPCIGGICLTGAEYTPKRTKLKGWQKNQKKVKKHR